jgi:hypothetical protein
MFGRNYCFDRELIKNLCAKVKIEEFKPKKVTIKKDEKDTTEEKCEDDEERV